MNKPFESLCGDSWADLFLTTNRERRNICPARWVDKGFRHTQSWRTTRRAGSYVHPWTWWSDGGWSGMVVWSRENRVQDRFCSHRIRTWESRIQWKNLLSYSTTSLKISTFISTISRVIRWIFLRIQRPLYRGWYRALWEALFHEWNIFSAHSPRWESRGNLEASLEKRYGGFHHWNPPMIYSGLESA